MQTHYKCLPKFVLDGLWVSGIKMANIFCSFSFWLIKAKTDFKTRLARGIADSLFDASQLKVNKFVKNDVSLMKLNFPALKKQENVLYQKTVLYFGIVKFLLWSPFVPIHSHQTEARWGNWTDGAVLVESKIFCINTVISKNLPPPYFYFARCLLTLNGPTTAIAVENTTFSFMIYF